MIHVSDEHLSSAWMLGQVKLLSNTFYMFHLPVWRDIDIRSVAALITCVCFSARLWDQLTPIDLISCDQDYGSSQICHFLSKKQQ